MPLTVAPFVAGSAASASFSVTRALSAPKISCTRDVAVSRSGCTRSCTVSRTFVAFSGSGSAEVRMPDSSLIVDERFAETSWNADWRVPGSAAVEACDHGVRDNSITTPRDRAYLNLVELRKHGVAQGVHPGLCRAVARRGEFGDGLRGGLRALESDALGLDLVDLLRGVRKQLVTELALEVVRALVLEGSLGRRRRRLIGGSTRLQLLHGNGEVVDDGCKSL